MLGIIATAATLVFAPPLAAGCLIVFVVLILLWMCWQLLLTLVT
jgi:hypothetical protein